MGLQKKRKRGALGLIRRIIIVAPTIDFADLRRLAYGLVHLSILEIHNNGLILPDSVPCSLVYCFFKSLPSLGELRIGCRTWSPCVYFRDAELGRVYPIQRILHALRRKYRSHPNQAGIRVLSLSVSHRFNVPAKEMAKLIQTGFLGECRDLYLGDVELDDSQKFIDFMRTAVHHCPLLRSIELHWTIRYMDVFLMHIEAVRACVLAAQARNIDTSRCLVLNETGRRGRERQMEYAMGR